MKFLMPLAIVQPCKCFPTLRACMWSLTTMALFMVFLVQVPSECLSTYTATPLRFCMIRSRRREILRQVRYFWMVLSSVPDKRLDRPGQDGGGSTYFSRSLLLEKPYSPASPSHASHWKGRSCKLTCFLFVLASLKPCEKYGHVILVHLNLRSSS